MSPSNRAGDAVDEQVDRDRASANGNGHGGAHGNGHEAPDGGPPAVSGSGSGSGGRRRSVVSPASSGTAPERGSSSSRGASSSSITKRSTRGTFPEDDDDAPGPPSVTAATDPLVPPPAAVTSPDPAVPDVPELDPQHPDPYAVARSVLEQASAAGVAASVVGEGIPAAAMPPPPVVTRPGREREHDEVATTPGSSVVAVPVPVAVPTGTPGVTGRPLLRSTGDELLLPDEPIAGPDPAAAGPTMSAHQVAPVPRVRGRRPRVRRVTRVLRHVDPWSVFKVAVVFNVVLYVVLLTAGVLLWNVAYATGTVDNMERFFESFGWSDFEFHGGEIFHSAWIAGLFGVIGLTGAAVLAATLFNLITDLVGGVRMTVLEEEVQERTMAPMRRFVVRRPTAPNDGDPSAGLRREVDRFPDPYVPTDDSGR